MPSDGAPTFSIGRLAKLFGYSSLNPVQTWIGAGLLRERTIGTGKTTRHLIAPEAVLAFVREHPDVYDWRTISDERLRDYARRVEERDPLVPIGELVASTGVSEQDLRVLARTGTVPLVSRGSGGVGGGKRSWWIRRSKMDGVASAIEEARRREDPVYALHSLLDLERPTGAATEPTARVVSVAAMPARRCPKCGARMMRTWSDETSQAAIDKCLSCGEEVAPEAAGTDPKALAVADEGLRPRMGRPPKQPATRASA